MGAYPVVAGPVGFANPDDPLTIGITTIVAAGAGIIPDIDHPDARPAAHFGLLSKTVAKITNKAADGHRMATHSLMFAGLLGAAAWACQFSVAGPYLAAVACGMCASVGLALVGPSLGFRVRPEADLGLGALVGWAVWYDYESMKSGLWAIAVYGVVIHCLCDAVTKGGVPFFYPLTRRKFAVGLFRVGGTGEAVASALGLAGFLYAGWRVLAAAPAI